MDLSPNFENPVQLSSQPMSTPILTPPQQSNMDLSPDFGNPEQSSSELILATLLTLLTPLPQTDREEPMDTWPDGKENLTVNGCPIPKPDYEESTIPLSSDNTHTDAGKQSEG